MFRDMKIRQNVAGRKVRAILFGKDFSCPHPQLQEWGKIPAHFCSKGFMRYTHLMEEATRFAIHVPELPSETVTPSPEFELEVRRLFLDHLAREARENPKYLANKAEYDANRRLGRKRAMARDAMLQQLCPYCGHPLPCYTHDMGKISLDGRGGLVHDGCADDDDSGAAKPGAGTAS